MNYMFLPFRRYFDFSGRSRRKEFWMFVLLNVIVAALAMLSAIGFSGLATLATGGAADVEMSDLGPVVTIALGAWIVFAIIPIISVTIRRLHDLGLSGWWLLGSMIAGMIPYVGMVVTIGFYVVLALPGSHGSNRFGSAPD